MTGAKGMQTFDPHITPRQYLTSEIPGAGGVIKQRPEDFIVEELPAYEPCGEGEHIYLLIQKTNMSTMHVARLLADHFGVRRDAIGIAGLKDRMAVTTQLFSVHVPGKEDSDFRSFEQPGATVMWMDRHTNKLRRGHLAGNRFVIRVRETSMSKVVHAHRAIAKLAAIGVPNRIGSQRFGMIRRNHVVGLALLKQDHQGVLDAMLGPSDEFPEMQAEARALYAAGKFEESMHAMPRGAHTERRVLAALARGEPAARAVRAIERLEHSFFITALQSAVFNALLDERIAAGKLDALMDGDLAFKHDSGACFPISAEMPESERAALGERLKQLEISPSGPMWGPEMTRAAGEVGRNEALALERVGLSEAFLSGLSRRDVEAMVGQRRAYRVPLSMPDVEGGRDEHGEYIKCVFELPRGAFATCVMQEIMKAEVGEEDEG